MRENSPFHLAMWERYYVKCRLKLNDMNFLAQQPMFLWSPTEKGSYIESDLCIKAHLPGVNSLRIHSQLLERKRLKWSHMCLCNCFRYYLTKSSFLLLKYCLSNVFIWVPILRVLLWYNQDAKWVWLFSVLWQFWFTCSLLLTQLLDEWNFLSALEKTNMFVFFSISYIVSGIWSSV